MQSRLSTLALSLMVVTSRALVILSGSFTSQIETHEGYTVPNVESQVITPNIP